MSDTRDIVERLREALPALKGWMLNRAEPGEDDGTAIVGGSHDDGDFAPIATVDTGLYYQDAHALPLAKAIAAAATAAPVLLAELDRLRAAATVVPQWRPIETAPDGVMLLFADMKAAEARHWVFCGWRYAGMQRFFAQMPDNTARSATHWMPLPAAPHTAQTEGCDG